MTDEEMNEGIVMVCIGLADDGVGCGFTRQCRVGDFYGDHPRDVCVHCGGLLIEDRERGKRLVLRPKIMGGTKGHDHAQDFLIVCRRQSQKDAADPHPKS